MLFAKFLARSRQRRRILKKHYEHAAERFRCCAFAVCKAKWRAGGRSVCRHGLFFKEPGVSCNCLANADAAEPDWQNAARMPTICAELKAIVVVPFQAHRFRRLGQLRGDLRNAWGHALDERVDDQVVVLAAVPAIDERAKHVRWKEMPFVAYAHLRERPRRCHRQ